MADHENRDAFFGGRRFDVEHALDMFAYSYVHFPAAGLYDVQSLEKFAKTLKNCH
jgi:hypothetical protein